ncbi:hypothetical protein QEG98_00230 [Myxococcus sp. MxC21-1]|uniref:hypothetical protein n=1 Tax=Myxococcus sp. MxC21-1 TaxID=3041439 RepID=UPI00292CCA96|nr:hypothetical protein [Myxococcus sp. MxC21-1]WNZ62326.1 hypothetical protein QEG98_00230 [Myxococcus sp. MxC21-1]
MRSRLFQVREEAREVLRLTRHGEREERAARRGTSGVFPGLTRAQQQPGLQGGGAHGGMGMAQGA